MKKQTAPANVPRFVHITLASDPVVAAAKHTLDSLIEAYLSPNLTLLEIHIEARAGRLTALEKFGLACRGELAEIVK